MDPFTHKVHAFQVDGDTGAYSSFMTFRANRALVMDDTCTLTSQCQTGQRWTGSDCRWTRACSVFPATVRVTVVP